MKYIVKIGVDKGMELVPHRHKDGKYVASPTRFKKDYIRTSSLDELASMARDGMRIRMSPKGNVARRAPSLVIPEIS